MTDRPTEQRTDKAGCRVACTRLKITRPDPRLPQSRVGGQGLFLRSPYHLGRSSSVNDCKNQKKVKCDGPTDGRTDGLTDGPTKQGVESRSTQLKKNVQCQTRSHRLSTNFERLMSLNKPLGCEKQGQVGQRCVLFE